MAFSWRRVRKGLKGEPDPEEYQQKKQALHDLQQQAAQGILDLYYFDESGFCLTPYLPYAWQEKGQTIRLEQRTKAESDLAVAAASILAREGFIDWLERRGKALGEKLGRGVSAEVKEAAKRVVEAGGPEALRKVAKLHFRTAHEVAPGHFPAPPPRRAWR